MNWTTFQTNNQSSEKAFESLCNQLFENWCKETFKDDISYFTVTNGSGGDGGVESYAILKDGDTIGLQAKWFYNVIESSHIAQIRGSIKTALKIRPNIKKYIVCVPRNLAPKTGRGENCEEQRWLDLVAEIKKAFPMLDLILWNDHQISKELQKESSSGILRYWFQNSGISYEKLVFAFEKSKQSWLFTKYVPELNTCGKIYETLINGVGNLDGREDLIKSFSSINSLAQTIDKPAKDLLGIIKENTKEGKELKEHIENLINMANNLINTTNSIIGHLKNDTCIATDISYDAFNYDFKSMAEVIRRNTLLFNNYWHTVAVTRILDKLAEFDCYELFNLYQQNISFKNLIFKGAPGTGKTHGVASAAEKILFDKYHAAIVIQARDIERTQTWKDIVLSNLGLSNNWEEEQLWQALISMVNSHKLSSSNLNSEIKITPKVLIIVDGIDESSTTEKWEERVKEGCVISKKYSQIKFCVTSRPLLFKEQIEGVDTKFLNVAGDVKIADLFDRYIEHFNIQVTNSLLLKNSLNTPLSLKLFCEINQGKTFEFDETYDVSLPVLLSKKISLIDEEFSKYGKTDVKNQYILKAIKELTELFFTNHTIEYEDLVETFKIKFNIDKAQASLLVDYLNKYGILNCYCEHGDSVFVGNKYIYSPGLRSFFDHASTLIILERYAHPSEINFSEFKNLSINTFYILAVVSIRKYGYLITENTTLSQSVDDFKLAEIQYWALIHSPNEVAKSFEKRIFEKMGISSDWLYTTTTRIVLPLARKTTHPLGVNLLDAFLNTFQKPAERDIIWSPTGYLRDSYEKKWNRYVSLDLIEEYSLEKTDTFDGLPTVYAWALSSLNNTLRADYRNELMKWAISQPMEFFNLFHKFSNVNDPQILTDLFSILMCVAYETNDFEFVDAAFNWSAENILSSEKIDLHRSIAIRYYAIAIVYKAIELKICDNESARKFLPPYSVDNHSIKLSKEALSGTRMGGYSGIHYDLSRYVLIDHIEGDFNCYNQSNKKELDSFLLKVKENLTECVNLNFGQFILSAAFAFITEMGWNENDFYNHNTDEQTGKIIGGVDCSILATHYHADHGAQSNVMTVCEKYVWLARDCIYGFLSDRLTLGESNDKITDYGMLQDFVIPMQELGQIDLDSIPEDSPWHIAEDSKVIINEDCNIGEDVVKQVEFSPDIDWEKWLFINDNNKYNIKAKDIAALYNYSCFESEYIETCLFMNSLIVDTATISLFITQIKEHYKRIYNVDELSGGMEADCYITPKECCWFTWKKHYEPYDLEDFEGLEIYAAVDKGCWSHQNFGDIYYRIPSVFMRGLLGINDSNGYVFYDKNREIRAEYTIAGKRHHTYQEYLWVDRKEILSLLASKGKTLVWIMREYRRESGLAHEKWGSYAAKDVLSIGYFKEDKFIVECLNKEIDDG